MYICRVIDYDRQKTIVIRRQSSKNKSLGSHWKNIPPVLACQVRSYVVLLLPWKGALSNLAGNDGREISVGGHDLVAGPLQVRCAREVCTFTCDTSAEAADRFVSISNIW